MYGYNKSCCAGGINDAWLLKLDLNGNIDWQKAYGTEGDDAAHSFLQTQDGKFIVGGGTGSLSYAWILELESDGTIAWQKKYDGNNYEYFMSIDQTSDEHYIAAGLTKSYGAGNSDAWVLKLDTDGEVAGCSDVKDNVFSITDTDVSAQDTNANIQNTSITPFETNVIAQNAPVPRSFVCGNPNASAGGPYLVALGYETQLDGTCVYPDFQEPLTFLWSPDDNLDDPTVEDPYYNTYSLTTAGIEDLTFTCEDSKNNSDTDSTTVVVYDPDGGFVTGGGWIESPEGSYMPDPPLAGKANFGFVSKYKKGATVPTGQTEFQFHMADLNFHSDSYQWLIVTGNNFARFKGSGTINEMGDYKFMLWAGDGEPDTFRIRIWEEDEITAVETDVYDNGMDQEIGGGSIVVHTKK